MADTDKPALVIVGHGSRVSNLPFETCVAAVTAALPDVLVTGAYLEFAHPPVTAALVAAAGRSRRVVVLPLFLFAAGHLKGDLPDCVRRAQEQVPAAEFRVAGPIGEAPALLSLCQSRLGPALPEGLAHADTDVLVVGRGSTDGAATKTFLARVDALRAALPVRSVQAGFLAAQEPPFERELERLLATRPRGVVLLPYLLFRGSLTEKLERVAANASALTAVSVAAPLGGDGLFCDWVAGRAAELLCWSS